jgi:hypothetical protein
LQKKEGKPMGRKNQICLIIAIGVALAFGVSGLCIAAGGHTQVGTGLAPTPVEIAVYTKEDKPVADANVVINSPGFFETTYRTDKNGVFTAMVPCHIKEAKSLTHEVTVNHDKYKVVKGTFVTEEGKCDKKQRVSFKLEPK